ncbi:hypothetical protein KC19_VG147300 [Ceratodon purpureus]|uniref:Secreted protein n=1 Tax=Ceratodon purpureus TaxID=3225 RepID=A0A8T0HQ81_CERPU|nr:hypothetical protein KC19_VG147300 [Ceratodon purpureus]
MHGTCISLICFFTYFSLFLRSSSQQLHHLCFVCFLSKKQYCSPDELSESSGVVVALFTARCGNGHDCRGVKKFL